MSPPRGVQVRSLGQDTDYWIHIEPGAALELGGVLGSLRPEGRVAIIADRTVAGLHAPAVRAGLGRPSDLYVFDPGEASKSVETWASLSESLLADHHDRGSVVVALGGGVTGDLAGFVAATLMRGVPVVQVPTTLLAMIDASVGGKTGVNTLQGKNLLGAFHAPAAVVIDPRLLETLPVGLRAQGLVEAVKHGAIRSVAHLERIEDAMDALLAAEPEVTAAVVAESVALKAEVVSADEREHGLRAILNFGHTLGHALEHLSGYRMGHGEAVAQGMVLEARLGEAIGVSDPGTAERLAGALRRLGLPIDGRLRYAAESVVARTRIDKKGRAGRARYVLLARPGMVAPAEGWLHDVPEERVVETLQVQR
ncbi:MAG: 3-dehydroquinate synthase [Gemmatimonadota bacterium]